MVISSQTPTVAVPGDTSAGDPQLLAQLAEAKQRVARAVRATRDHALLADLFSKLGQSDEAAHALRLAVSLPHGLPADAEALGFTAFGLGEHALAAHFYRHVVEAAPADAQGWYNLATALRNIGALEEAGDACDRCLAIDAAMAQAALLRSHLKTQTAAANHVDTLRASLRRASAPSAGILLHYALGKELDDLGEHGEAFAHFAAGAAARRATLRYDVAQDVLKLERIAQVFSAGALARAPAPDTMVRSLFIVGLPRSGTTMVERVLTGHPMVESNGETDNLLAALMEGTPAAGGDIFQRVARASPDIVQAAYRRRGGYRGQAVLLIEKLPMNYLYAGAVRLTMPGARLARMRRDPMDNLFAMFTTLFGVGYPFSYALDELAAYYVAYEKLMAHWSRTVGAPWLDLSYEAFVDAPREEGARLARHAGVAWTDDMVRIERNKAPSATASAEQVRRPIYKTAVGRWRPYAHQLAPLAERLDAAGIDLCAS